MVAACKSGRKASNRPSMMAIAKGQITVSGPSNHDCLIGPNLFLETLTAHRR